MQLPLTASSAVIAHTPGCGENYVEPAADQGDFLALTGYAQHGDLNDEPAALVQVRFADLPTSDAPVMLNFDAALEYAKTYGQREGSMWSNNVTIVVRKAPELSVPVVAAQLAFRPCTSLPTTTKSPVHLPLSPNNVSTPSKAPKRGKT